MWPAAPQVRLWSPERLSLESNKIRRALESRARRAATGAAQAPGTWIRTMSFSTPSRPPKTVSLSIFSVTFSSVFSS
jgi:hypothetical protein